MTHLRTNPLREYFDNNSGRLIHKWDHYFDVYERHFSRYVGKEVVILEIGVSQGGSLQMWKSYFGDKARIIGVDVDPRCKSLEEPQVEIYIGSQSDRGFLRELKSKLPKIDILIDDGGHTMEQQIVTFEELFDHVKDDGVFLCEDLHTSYWLTYGGGHKRPGTFIEYAKNWIDLLHADHSEESSLRVTPFTRSAFGVHFYSSVVVVEKRPWGPPQDRRTGTPSFSSPPGPDETTPAYRGTKIVNTLLRRVGLGSWRWR